MSTDDLFAPHGAFATDWLAQSDPRAFDGTASAGPDSYDHHDSLAFLTGNPFSALDVKGAGMHVALTQDELARALMGGIDGGVGGGGTGAARMGDLSSAGTSTAGGRSDAGSSPYSSSMSHYGGGGGGGGQGGAHPSAQFDFSDAALGNSPPFSLPHNLQCDFDTAALQSLFTNSSPTTGHGVNAHLSPYPPATTYPPLQTRSPASSVSPYAASVSTFPQHQQQQQQQQIDTRGMSGFNPAQLFAPTPASGTSPLAPRLSVDYTSPLSTFSSFSPPVAAHAPLPVAPPQHAHQQQHQARPQQPAFTSLAATAGIAVPTLHAGPSAQSGLYGFSGAHDSSSSAAAAATLGGGARGRTTRTRTQAPLEAGAQEAEQRGRSPMEVIANAGLQSATHPARASPSPLLLSHRSDLATDPASCTARSPPSAQPGCQLARHEPHVGAQGRSGRGRRGRAGRAQAGAGQGRQEGQEGRPRAQCVSLSLSLSWPLSSSPPCKLD